MTYPAPSVPPDCRLYVGTGRYDDGSTGYDGDPVALTGLAVTWGRTTLLDQPSPASATFTVLDEDGGQRFRDRLYVGAPVEVRAGAIIYPDPTVSIALDPGFELAGTPAGTVVGGTIVNTTNGRPAGAPGTRSAKVSPAYASRSVTVTLPPAPFTPDPVGWDAIPKTQGGQTWSVGVSVCVPDWLGVADGLVRVFAQVVGFPGPTGNVAVTLGPRVELPVHAGVWYPYAITVTPPQGLWLGLRLVAQPVGPAWRDVPAATTWASLGGSPAWQGVGVLWLDNLAILAPAAGALVEGVVFAGRVTDLAARYDRAAGGTWVDVIAQDAMAELGNRPVGRTAWPAETLGARASRAFTGAELPPTTYSLTVDGSAAAVPVSLRPVAPTGVAAILYELGTSIGGAVWATTSIVGHTVVRVEDVANRPAMARLAMVGGVVVIVDGLDPVTGPGIVLDACLPLLDPVTWVSDSADLATDVEVAWLRQVTIDGQPDTEAAVEFARDVALRDRVGEYAVSVQTVLADLAVASTLASAILARMQSVGWRVSGLVWQMAPAELLSGADLQNVMRILDATRRIGLPITLTELPAWSPISPTPTLYQYLEGGRFVYDLGAWTLELLTVDTASVGRADIPWNALPADWSWNEFDPDIAWADLAGVTV